MPIELPETTLAEIRKNLDSVKKDIAKSNDELNNSVETQEKKRETVISQNVINKSKTDLKSDEKARFLNISKIFVTEWVKQIKKFQQDQEKKKKLTGEIPNVKKKTKVPYEFLSNLMAKKKQTMPVVKTKKESSWLKKILTVIGFLGLGWVIFKTVISRIPGQVWDAIKDLGSDIGDLAMNIFSSVWDELKSDLSALWDWIKKQLHLEEIGNFFTSSWDKLAGWFDSLWEGIKNTWKSVSDYIMNLPGRIWDWICDVAKAIFDPIVEAIKTAWNWLKEKVLAVWDWIKEQIDKFWEGLKKTWTSVVNFFSGIWDWVTDTFSFSKIWENIKKFISSFIDTLKEDLRLLLSGQILEFVKRKFNFITDMFNKAISAIKKITPSSWWGDDEKDEKTVTKSQVKTEVKSDVKKVIEKQEEIVLKDNILETVKNICDRMNIFFSGNENGFIDLSEKLLKQCGEGFSNLINQFEKIKLENIYNVEQDVTYKDSYDQSDKSVKTINNDFSKTNNSDYSITYNTIDIPALNEAISTLKKQSDKEVKLLESQNDYLVKMITNIDGLGTKLGWLDPKKFKEQPNNNIIPIIGSFGKQESTSYNTIELKLAQRTYASAFS